MDGSLELLVDKLHEFLGEFTELNNNLAKATEQLTNITTELNRIRRLKAHELHCEFDADGVLHTDV